MAKTIIKHVGAFDYDALYACMYEWFKENHYGLNEKSYKHSQGKDEIVWEAEHDYDAYFKSKMTVTADIQGKQKVEVKVGTGTKVMTYARIEIILEENLVTDHYERFKGKPKLKQFFETLVWSGKKGGMEDDSYYKMYNLQSVIKEKLNMFSSYNAF